MLNYIKRNKCGRRLLWFIADVLSIVNNLIPKKNHQILFYDSMREYFGDNTEALYTWMVENKYDRKYKLVCCLPLVQHKLFSTKHTTVGAIRGVYEYLRSKYVFYSFGGFWIKPAKNQVVVNQWHGVPFKAVGKLTSDQPYPDEVIDNFTYVLAGSEFYIPIMASVFGCEEKKVKVIGNARNDYLFSKKEALKILGINKEKYVKTILWMPTFRQSKDGKYDAGGDKKSETLLPILTSFESLKQFDEYLVKMEVFVIIKVHPLAKFKLFDNLDNIKLVTDADIIPYGVKLYEFVKDFDALLTDYSSIFCDYLILNRPMGFTLDDIDRYKNKRGFVFDNITSYMPGHHLYNCNDLYKFIDDIVNDRDNYKNMRKKILPLFCKYDDSDNCKRLIEEIGIEK